MANINSVIVIDCVNAAENYNDFGNYVYVVDSKNDYGIAKEKASIQQMTVKCKFADSAYFYSRGIVPFDMPQIKSIDAPGCNVVANPVGHPGTFMVKPGGNDIYTLTITILMPDDTEHNCVIKLNSKE